jgi:hypothetical protein
MWKHFSHHQINLSNCERKSHRKMSNCLSSLAIKIHNNNAKEDEVSKQQHFASRHKNASSE